MAVPSPQSAKQQIRAAARTERMRFVSSLEPDTRRALEEQLATLLSPFIADAKIVGSYSPIGSEISPIPIERWVRSAGKKIAFPHFDPGASQFTFRQGEPIMAGPFGINQPRDRDPQVNPDLVLVPLVAVGDGGVRLGQGKGHYDRVLAGLKKAGAMLIGIGWKVQRVGPITAQPWDVPVDLFASPRGIEDFRHA